MTWNNHGKKSRRQQKATIWWYIKYRCISILFSDSWNWCQYMTQKGSQCFTWMYLYPMFSVWRHQISLVTFPKIFFFFKSFIFDDVIKWWRFYFFTCWTRFASLSQVYLKFISSLSRWIKFLITDMCQSNFFQQKN